MGNDLKWPAGAAADIVFGLSYRKDGSMRLSDDKNGDQSAVLENRRKFFGSKGIDERKVVAAGLVHGNKVAIVTEGDGGKLAPETDALITNVPGLVLAITVGDCVPVYFYDPVARAVGLAHAGWQGAERCIATVVVANMVQTYGTKPSNLLVYVGPCIQQHHFEVKEDVAAKFSAYPQRINRYRDRIMIDLSGVIFDQLASMGVGGKNAALDQLCTYCEESKYFSYRRDRPPKVEAMVAYIGLK